MTERAGCAVTDAYWREQGRTYERDFRRTPAFVAQENRLLAVLDGLRFDSVLDVGCGFGRLGRLILDRFPHVVYTGLDVSPHQIDAARRRIPEGSFMTGSLLDYAGPGADLVLAAEVLMHLLPTDVGSAVDRLRRLASRHVVTVDWTEPVSGKIDPHNFLHDYTALGLLPLERVGLQSIHYAEPLP